MKKFYKGFNEDLTCRGFQYEEGKTFKVDGDVILPDTYYTLQNGKPVKIENL